MTLLEVASKLEQDRRALWVKVVEIGVGKYHSGLNNAVEVADAALAEFDKRFTADRPELPIDEGTEAGEPEIPLTMGHLHRESKIEG